MRKNGLRPRAVGALAVVATTLFLLLCLFNYGSEGVAAAVEPALHLRIAGWFVGVFGIGAYAVVLLPLAWGVVVYFREDTPSLTMRAVGTGLLACASAMIAGLLQAPEPGLWAGAVGSYTASLVGWFADLFGGSYGASVATAGAWLASVVLFVVSLIWATDWMFHSLRRGEFHASPRTRPQIPTEPTVADLRDAEEEASEDRMVVTLPTPSAGDVEELATKPVDPAEPVPVPDVPEGFSSHEDSGRVVLRGPVGYRGVEFLTPSDELASPDEPEERVAHDVSNRSSGNTELVDDMFDMEIEPEAFAASPAETAETVETVESVDADLTETAAVQTGELETGVVETATAADLLARFSTPAQEETAQPTDEMEDEGDTAVVQADDRPRSGIGLPVAAPAEMGFVDEFFTVAGDSPAFGGAPTFGGDGASSASEVEATYGVSATAETTESPEAREVAAEDEPAPEPQPTPNAAESRGEPVFVDEVIFAPAAFALIDDEMPAPIAARSATRPAETASEETASPESAPAPSAPLAAPVQESLFGDGVALDPERVDPAFADPLLHDAVSAVLEAGRSSTMLLQRHFGIGHARGLRLLEQMEQIGVVGAEDDVGNRDLLVTADEWEAALQSPAGSQ